LSDTDAENLDTSIEEGEITTGGRITTDAESGENLANVNAHPDELGVRP
jgi:hypothetical protein